MMMKRIIAIGVMVVVGILLTACGTENGQLSPQEIINTALQESEAPVSYYGEYTMVTDDDSVSLEAKEWASKDFKRRIEVASTDGKEESIAINDGVSVQMYDKVSNTATIMEIGENEMAVLQEQTPRKQAERMLELVKDSHELSAGEDEEIAGRPTYHIIAKAKKDSTLLGDMEMWIDKKTWLALKTITKSADIQSTIEYTKIEFNPEMDEDLFVLDIPEGAHVETINEEAYTEKEATIEEMLDELGPFYRPAEENSLKLSSITVLEGIEDRLEFSLNYQKDDMAAFSLSIFKELPSEVDLGATGEGEEITIRGQKATKTEMGEFRMIDWSEGGLQYAVVLENPSIEFDEVIQHLENMVLVE